MKKTLLAAAVLAAAGNAAAANDFGALTEQRLSAQTFEYFGFFHPAKDIASDGTTDIDRVPGQSARDLVDVARGLRARILTRDAAHRADMFSLWPAKHPTHTLWCIEESRSVIVDRDTSDATTNDEGEAVPAYTPGVDKLNPSVQAISLADGSVRTLLRGMSHCDGIRTTPWGTVLVTEEAEDGAAYEIIHPLASENHVVYDRASGEVRDADGNKSGNIVKRTALPIMSWEGLAITADGVVYAGDELRPGSAAADIDGGALYKFVPDTPAAGEIDALARSPFVSGKVYAFQASCRSGRQQFGQGCEIGKGVWVEVTAATARADANAQGATGYYRPEDLHRDPTYSGKGIRFCWTNTGNTDADNWGETLCGIDTRPMKTGREAGEVNQYVSVNRFIEGDPTMNAHDNLAFQPHTGNLYIIEDRPNGEIWACLPDGADRDIKSDGCVRVLTVLDRSAEPTGFGFGAAGTVAYMSIQHSDDAHMPRVDEFATDDILIIEGFRIRDNMTRHDEDRKDD